MSRDAFRDFLLSGDEDDLLPEDLRREITIEGLGLPVIITVKHITIGPYCLTYKGWKKLSPAELFKLDERLPEFWFRFEKVFKCITKDMKRKLKGPLA